MVLLLSTYDLGRQPFGLASPTAWLRRAGVEVVPLDLSRQRLDQGLVARATLVALYLPMHTATRLALPVIERVRAINPLARICAYGLYAPLNADLLHDHGVTAVLGPEFEEDLVALATGAAVPATPARLPRLRFIAPERGDLPPPDRYATVQMPDGTRRIAGAVDASRGCKHRCRHCPIVPVYGGQFRVVPAEVVLADIGAQVERGAEHITFADPDFLNGPSHARRIVERLHEAWPALTYDVTIKVEHLLRHRDVLPILSRTGCLVVTSAVEAVDDGILARLEKGHTRADVIEAVRACRNAGVTLAPTFVAFTPWTTVDGYRDLLDTVDTLDLVGHVAPVQWGIRLLVTWQSRLLELPDVRRIAGTFDSRTLTYPWRHPDRRVDELQAAVMREAGDSLSRSRHDVFDAVRRHACSTGGDSRLPPSRDDRPRASRATIPYLDE
ncbi:MAG: CUAEP/CCAEP-tail radical SAM protein, partial [Acidobacteriota bacterium]|nr:CUAEP/CCAEP-tail radical SAM protein [Acidobacteriota bacterium]